MTGQTPEKLKIFLALAHQLGAAQSFSAKNPALENVSGTSPNDFFSPIKEYLTNAEAAEFERLAADYRNKTETEKAEWRGAVLRKIGNDEQLIDETVHRSHINDALKREVPAVRKMVEKESNDAVSPLEKTVRRAFAKQFVALRNLPKPTAFDFLSGAELARLIRLAGIREVALACVRIEAVEAVAAFLRTFSAEDARVIAAQLIGLRNSSEERLTFAEILVQTALEIEPQPAAMLDALGICLLGIALCESTSERVRFTNQKLPLEAIEKLPEIIADRCRRTPGDLQRKINVQVEHLAATIAGTNLRETKENLSNG